MKDFDLIKENWTEQDGKEFSEWLAAQALSSEKCRFEKKIVNTALPCIAIPAPRTKEIAKEINKGNAAAFLKLMLWNNHSETVVNGELIAKCKDFGEMCAFLDEYSEKVDNWAACDILKFKINDKNAKDFEKLARRYYGDKLPFRRRIALIIMFKFIERDIDLVFELAGGLSDETEYYVNMANAWLICECFIKNRERTLAFLEERKLNAFTANKAVSKIRDSFRVSAEDKERVKKYKIEPSVQLR